MIDRKIPLSKLPAFEAVGRLKSITRASHELHLSQAAVSRQISQLESRLGVTLFERGHRSISLTSTGEELYRSVSVALRLIRETVKGIRPQPHSGSINIATDLAFAHFWLIPRLDLFQKSVDGFALSVTASDIEEDCLKPEVDLPIVYGKGDWPGYVSRFLFEEEIFPVCSPGYLAQLENVTQPKDLLSGKLLHVSGGPTTWVNWNEWLSHHDVEIPADNRRTEFNSLPWTIQAACSGQGIALGWKYLCDDLLASETLIRPIPEVLRTDRNYYMLYPVETKVSDDLDKIYQWISGFIHA